MVRQVDLKALVSHIVKGDGSDKCRICMGDTTEGQVYLGDTVMMDGDRHVTLAELLETITGVQVSEESCLPQRICDKCSRDTIEASAFIKLCKNSQLHWREAATNLSQISKPSNEDKAYYLIYDKGLRVVRDQTKTEPSKSEAVERINVCLSENPSESWSVKVLQDVPDVIESDHVTISSDESETSEQKIIKKYSCRTCAKQFLSAVDLNSHLKSTLQRACRYCGSIMGREKLTKHFMKVHNKLFFECNICFQLFENEKSVAPHLSKYHNFLSYNCSDCGKGFLNQRALTTHQVSHALFYCRSCNKSYENRKCLLHHQTQCKTVKRQPGTNFICDYCGANYLNKTALKAHITQKHLYILPYQCQICGKKASTLSNLRVHQKIHNTNKNIYECKCGAKLGSEVGLSLHLRIHTGEKPYECNVCGEKIFSSRGRDHFNRKHGSGEDQELSSTIHRAC